MTGARNYTDEDVTGLGVSFFAAGLPQGGIYYGF